MLRHVLPAYSVVENSSAHAKAARLEQQVKKVQRKCKFRIWGENISVTHNHHKFVSVIQNSQTPPSGMFSTDV